MKANYSSAAFTNAAGVANIPASAEVEVRREDTSALAAIYEDEAGTTPLANPFNADANGRFSFYANGLDRGYSVKVTKDAFTHTVRNQAVGNAAQRDVSAFGAELMQAADEVAAALLLKVPRALFAYTGANVVNAGSSLEDGITGYTLPADTLEVGSKLVIHAWGFSEDTANTKAVGVMVGATEVAGVVLPADDPYNVRFDIEIVQTGVGAQKVSFDIQVASPASAGVALNAGVTAINEAAANAIKTTTDAGAASEFTWQGMTIEFWPAP